MAKNQSWHTSTAALVSIIMQPGLSIVASVVHIENRLFGHAGFLTVVICDAIAHADVEPLARDDLKSLIVLGIGVADVVWAQGAVPSSCKAYPLYQFSSCW